MAAVLDALDYIVIVAMLAISAGIGVFFAVRSGRRQTSYDYFLGSRTMSVVPAAISYSVTVLSAVTYLGTPAEVYMHGPMYALIVLSTLHVPLIVAFVFVPVFYRLKLTTMYEYLALRFNNKLRYSAVLVKSTNEFLQMGILVYTPALALNVTAGLSLPISILSLGLICAFYTSIGGIRAVIWTDVFQAIAMLVGLSVMIIFGTINIGGVAEGWNRAVEGERGDLFDFRIDPTIRYTFWSTLLGGSFLWLGIGANKQSLMQRYNSCKTERDAKLVSWLGMVVMALLDVLAVATGMTIFAYYYKCDPLTSDEITRPDQIVPYFVIDLFHSYPGVPGLLIGGAFCASLSTVSSLINSLAAVAGQNIVRVAWPDLSEVKYALIVKIMSFMLGLASIAIAFLASSLGNVVPLVVSLAGVASGPVLGVYILGMVFPRATSEGALCGLAGGVTVGLVQFFGSQVFPSTRRQLPRSVEGCYSDFNISSPLLAGDEFTDGITTDGIIYEPTYESTSPSVPISPNPAFFQLSYFYLPAITTTTCVVIGLVVSYIVSWSHPRKVDPSLLTPAISRFYAEKNKAKGGSSYGLKEVNGRDISLKTI